MEVRLGGRLVKGKDADERKEGDGNVRWLKREVRIRWEKGRVILGIGV